MSSLVPQVAIVTPAADATFSHGTPVPIAAQATDTDGHVSQVAFYADSTLVGVANSSPYTVTWEGAPVGQHVLTAVATDDAGMNATSAPVAINVTPLSDNRSPVLEFIGTQTAAEETALTFVAAASDPDHDSLTYSLIGAPAGAAIDPLSGAFTWTPTEAQGPESYAFTVRVTDSGSPALAVDQTVGVNVLEVNKAPVVAAVADSTVSEGATMTASISASDSDLPVNGITYALLDGPAGSAMDAATGALTFTPTEAQGPGSYRLTVRATDDGSPSLSATTAFTVLVNEVNQAPSLAPIGGKTVAEGSTLTFTASATDSDLPANTLTYSLVDAPAGATIQPVTGTFSWTPGVADVGSRAFFVRVTDDATPPLSSQTSVSVTVTTRADLTFTAVSTAAGTVALGGTVSVTSSVANVGGAAAGAFVTSFSLSPDGVSGGVDDLPFSQVRSISSLAAGATSSGSTTLTISPTTPVGIYYLCAYADGAGVVAEGNETNNALCSTSIITVSAPDLRVATLSPGASTAAAGSRLKVAYSVVNDGGWKTSAWSMVAFAFSTDPLWSNDDQRFTAQGSFGPLSAGATFTGTLDLVVPTDTVAGIYYVCALADVTGVVLESNESNNSLCSTVTVEVPKTTTGVDLTLTALSPKSSVVALGATVSVSSSVKNAGNAAAGAFATYFSLSRDGAYGGLDDVPLAEVRSVASLAAGATSSASIVITVPASTSVGNYFVCAYADGANAILEGDEANNALCSAVAINVSAPDVRVTTLSPVATVVAPGARLKTSYVVANDGGLKTSSWSGVAFALSTDANWSNDDRPFAAVGSIGPLAAGASKTATLDLTVAADAAPGSYYLCAIADSGGVIPESDEGNNASCSTVQIQVR